MDNPGIYTLAALPIGAAISPAKLLTPQIDLDGMASVTIEASLKVGGGSGTVTAIVASSFDGVSWRHIARFDFSGAGTKHAVIATDAKAVTPYADLGSEGVNQGLLGNQLAVLLSSSGTFTDTTLAINAAVR